jgi:hypothetical protein
MLIYGTRWVAVTWASCFIGALLAKSRRCIRPVVRKGKFTLFYPAWRQVNGSVGGDSRSPVLSMTMDFLTFEVFGRRVKVPGFARWAAAIALPPGPQVDRLRNFGPTL